MSEDLELSWSIDALVMKQSYSLSTASDFHLHADHKYLFLKSKRKNLHLEGSGWSFEDGLE
jgi:hypothetical protein